MKKLFIYKLLFLLLACGLLKAHEGHHTESQTAAISIDENNQTVLFQGPSSEFQQALRRLGNLHLVFLHFPIALIVMATAAEILFWWTQYTPYDAIARFLIDSAAVFAVPTALFGLALSTVGTYPDDQAVLLFWHRFFGMSTAFLAVSAAILKELSMRRDQEWIVNGYYACLLLAFLSVSITGYLGGDLTFGITSF